MDKQYGIFPNPVPFNLSACYPGLSNVFGIIPPNQNSKPSGSLPVMWNRACAARLSFGSDTKISQMRMILSQKNISTLEDGTYFEGRVTEWNPYKKLSYTWGEDTREQSEVTYEIIPKKNYKVLLRLTHRRLGDDPTTLISVAPDGIRIWTLWLTGLKAQRPKGFGAYILTWKRSMNRSSVTSKMSC